MVLLVIVSNKPNEFSKEIMISAVPLVLFCEQHDF